MDSLGIDIGGTRTKVALVDCCGEVLEQRIVDTARDRDALISIVRQQIDEFADAETSIGLGAPGLASWDNREIAWMRGRLEAVEGLRWSDYVGRDVRVLNDAHATTVGEAWVGAAAGVSNVLVLTLGTGVGGGVILNNRLYQGSTGRAGHLGHVTVEAKGPPDIVGTPGSLEDAIGNHTLTRRTNGRFLDTKDMVAAAQRGDSAARGFWNESIEALAAAITSLVNAFDPQMIVVGGGIAECGAALMDTLQAAMDRCEWRPYGERVPIVPAALGTFAGAIGAARFAMLCAQQEMVRR